jgi:multiple sugar transport system ATP-binding protein
MAGVRISGVGKAFGATRVLRGVSIEIADGEFVVLVGPSGCGKSTLLRMIAGLELITEGEIAIGGRVINDVAPKERDIAMVFQSYALYPNMTVTQNMEFALKLRRVAADEVRKRVAHAARVLGIDRLLQRRPAALSGGQRQRVAMGRAIVRAPQVFFFDEPLSNLDAKLRVSVRTEIKKQHRQMKTTTIYVTHDQIEAMTLADRIVVMRDGVVEQIGSPLELYDRPSNTFVAGFIGSPAMNFIHGGVRVGRGFVSDDGVALPLAPNADARERDALIYGIRPEHLRVADDGVPAEVVVVEPTGADTHAVMQVGATQCTCTLRGRARLSPGQQVRLALDTTAVHLFDAASGTRLH